MIGGIKNSLTKNVCKIKTLAVTNSSSERENWSNPLSVMLRPSQSTIAIELKSVTVTQCSNITITGLHKLLLVIWCYSAA